MIPADVRRALGSLPRVLGGLAALGALLWLASGLYSVRPEQRGVVRRFGKITDDAVLPGIHFHWPWPIETVDRPAVTEVRSLGVSFGSTPPGAQAEPEGQRESLLSGDANVVQAAVLVQYTVKAPGEWLLSVADPEALLRRVTQAEGTALLVQRDIDEMLTSGRQALQVDLKDAVQRRADAYRLGIRVTSVQLQRVEPPGKVAEAFKDVGAAREDKQKLVQEAEGDRNHRLPEARAEAQRMRAEAESYARERTAWAKGESDRFLAAWEEYRRAKSVTARRLHLETMEEVLGKVRKVVVDPAAERLVQGRATGTN